MLIQQNHSLDKAFTEVKDQLKRAGVDTKHKFRFFSVATVELSENRIPKSRMVVLRSFSDDWTFEFYTDHRSSKVKEIEENPFITALFWDPSKRVQVRIEANVSIHNQDELAAKRWEDIQGDAQKAYTSVPSPGTPVDTIEDAYQWSESFSSEYFSVLICKAAKIKALQISGMEHLAFECSRQKVSQPWEKTWIAP